MYIYICILIYNYLILLDRKQDNKCQFLSFQKTFPETVFAAPKSRPRIAKALNLLPAYQSVP